MASLTLWYGDLAVADLDEVTEHQGTWFADYRLSRDLPARMRDFIQFSRDCLAIADFEESQLLAYREFLGDTWSVREGDAVQKLDGAPLFLSEVELSWASPTKVENRSV